jgi:photosystem II stability/assembly factor-like uncharacterized protein
MKRLFVFAPAIVLVLFVLISAVLKESETGEKIAEGPESFTGLALGDIMPTGPFAEINRDKSSLLNIVFKSTDSGQTWQGISKGLPKTEQPVNFFAGGSDLYIQVKNVMYHSKSNLQTPVWAEENVPNLQIASFRPSTTIAFNRSGIMTFNHQGQIYKKVPGAVTWLPIYTSFKQHSVRTIFETSNGTVFLGCDQGLYNLLMRGKTGNKYKKDW